MQATATQQFEFGLLSSIRLMNRFEATDARDKLYALLGVVNTQDIAILPDCNKSVSGVYTDFVSALLPDKRRLADRFYNLACGFLYVPGSLLPQLSRVKRTSRRVPQERLKELEAFNDYVYTYAL